MTVLDRQNCSFIAYAKTPSFTINYSVDIVAIIPSAVSNLMDKLKFDKLCQIGCPNYAKKWSCPPYAPEYQIFVEDWKHLHLFYMAAEVKQFFYIKNDYLKIKAANTILKSRADKYLRVMASKYGKYITTGSCRLCKPCKCKIGQPCSILIK